MHVVSCQQSRKTCKPCHPPHRDLELQLMRQLHRKHKYNYNNIVNTSNRELCLLQLLRQLLLLNTPIPTTTSKCCYPTTTTAIAAFLLQQLRAITMVAPTRTTLLTGLCDNLKLRLL